MLLWRLNHLQKKKKKQRNKSTYAQSLSALRGRTEEYFWMTSTVGAPLRTLLSLRLSKAGRRRGSYQSCVISSQLTGLPSHKKVRTRVHGRRAGLLGQAASKPGAAGRRSESHLAVWGQEQPVCLDFFDELQGKDSDASAESAESSWWTRKDPERRASREAGSELINITSLEQSVFIYFILQVGLGMHLPARFLRLAQEAVAARCHWGSQRNTKRK